MSGDPSRLHPRLRAISNLGPFVCASRSEIANTMATTPGSAADRDEAVAFAAPDFSVERQAIEQMSPQARRRRKKAVKKRKKIGEHPPADQSYVNVVIELQRARAPETNVVSQDAVAKVEGMLAKRIKAAQAEDPEMGATMLARRSFISATVPVDLLEELKRQPEVAFVHPAESLRLDLPLSTEAVKPRRAPSAMKICMRAAKACSSASLMSGALTSPIPTSSAPMARRVFCGSGIRRPTECAPRLPRQGTS